MNNDFNKVFGGGFLFGVALTLMAFSFGLTIQIQREAIKKGFAEYNQTTGQWQWKEKDGE